MSHLLLPPNSTALERAVADVAGRATFADVYLPITGIKLDNPPDDWLDFLLYEWGLWEFLPFFANKRELIANALHFHRIRGTKASVHMALSWAGLVATIIEYEPSELMAELVQSSHQPYLHFGEFDLAVDDELDKTQITKMIELANLAKPIRSRLTRLVGGFDRRKFVLDDSHLSCAYLSDDSGIQVEQGDLSHALASPLPKLSLQRRLVGHAAMPDVRVDTSTVVHFCHEIHAWQADMPYLDDAPDPVEVMMVLSGGGTLAASLYVGQIWADQSWADSSWDKTREMVTTHHQLIND